MSNTKFLDEHIVLRVSREASAAITAHRLVAVNGANHRQIDQVAAANAKCFGVAKAVAVAGDEIQVAVAGLLAVDAGGAIVPGDELVSDAAGKVVPRGAVVNVKYNVVGQAVTAAAAGELVMVAWGPYGVWGTNAS